MAMDMDTVYKEAAIGNFEAFRGLKQDELLQLVTPINKDTILHIHITARSKLSYVDFYIMHVMLGYLRPLETAFLRKLSRSWDSSSIDFVKKVLEECDGLRWKTNSEDETLLHLAARYGHNDIVQVLIPKRQNPISRDLEAGVEDQEVDQEAAMRMLVKKTKAKDTPLHEAARYNHPQVVKTLIRIDPNHSYDTNDDDKTPLYLAAEKGHGTVVSEILTSSCAYEGPAGKTALHAAVLNNDTVITRMLLSKLENLNKEADELGWVPLHYAAQKGLLGIVIILMEKDSSTATIGDKDHKMIPLHIAAKYRRADVMREIIFRCPHSCEVVDNTGKNLLHFVIEGNCKRTLNAALCNPFIRSNLVHRRNNQGKRPLDQIPTTFNFHRFMKPLPWPTLRQTIAENGSKDDDDDEEEEDQGKTRTVKGKKKRVSKEGWIYNDQLQIYLVVAALVATVTFAAAFTMPGGYVSDNGSPVLIKLISFKVFVLADVTSLTLSVIAVIIPIYMVEVERRSLRAALKVASTATFCALIAMVVAFSAGAFAVLSRPDRELAVLCCFLPLSLAFTSVCFYIILMMPANPGGVRFSVDQRLDSSVVDQYYLSYIMDKSKDL